MRSIAGRFGVAVLAVALATALRFAAQPYLGPRAIYTFYFIAVTASALYGGWGAGLAALLMSAFVATFAFVPPPFQLSVSIPADWIELSAYLITGLVLTELVARERDTRARSQASEARYRELVETAQDMIWAFDLDGRITFINDEASRAMLGYGAAEIVGKPWAELAAAEDRATLEREFAKVVTGARAFELPVTAIAKSGEQRKLLINAVARRGASGEVIGITGTAIDMTDRRRQEEDLRLFRFLMDQGADGIVIVDARTRAIIDVNETFCSWVDYPRAELIGGTTERVFVPGTSWEQAGIEAHELGHSTEAPTVTPVIMVEYRRRDGTTVRREAGYRHVLVGNRELVVVVARDVSERTRLELQLQQAQKLEGIGRLAGGIAHDFNNVLTAIGGYTELARRALPPDHEASGDLDQVRFAAGRAASLTRQLLAFARKQIIQPQLISINELVRRMEGLLTRLLGEDITVNVVTSDDLWLVNVDPGQFEQILVNLGVNARDAMPNGGTLTIETANVVLGAEYARQHTGVVAGDYVRLAVSDTGIGMTEQVQQHVFEPFFTTKEVGQGTGLGLATTHGIVRQSGGHIWLYSEPGSGTTFKIYLPRALSSRPAPAKAESTTAPSGSETVLVVEDEVLVRQFAVAALQRLGYRTIDAANGSDALKAAASFTDPIHLLVTDVVMPRMNGRELATRLGDVHPETRVLFASGYTDNTIVHHGVLDPGVAFLQKPYSIAELGQKVREVLDAAE